MYHQTTIEKRRTTVIKGVNPLLLASYSRLSDIEFEDLSILAAASECHFVPSDNVVYRQGEPAQGVYLVLDGTVKLEHRESVHTVMERELVGLYTTFGDRALLGEYIRSYTATANSYSILVRMPLPPLQDILRSYPDLAGDWTYDIMTRPVHRARYRRTAGMIAEIFDVFSAA